MKKKYIIIPLMVVASLVGSGIAYSEALKTDTEGIEHPANKEFTQEGNIWYKQDVVELYDEDGAITTVVVRTFVEDHNGQGGSVHTDLNVEYPDVLADYLKNPSSLDSLLPKIAAGAVVHMTTNVLAPLYKKTPQELFEATTLTYPHLQKDGKEITEKAPIEKSILTLELEKLLEE